MNPLRADLHAHSTASDGALAPAALVAAAADAGLNMLALTDHDTVAGLAEAAVAATASRIALVAGIELSAEWNGSSLHVLGLGIDPMAPAFEAALATQAAARRTRGDEIAAKLTRLGHAAAVERARASAAGALTRTHFAHGLVATGAAADVGAAFDRYLARGRPAFVRGAWYSLEAATTLIRDAGGHASLAHPLRYKLSGGALRRLVDAFRTAGGAALEVVSGRAAPQQLATLAGHARRAQLAGTGGSDFHAPGARWAALGQLSAMPDGIEDLAQRFVRVTA